MVGKVTIPAAPRHSSLKWWRQRYDFGFVENGLVIYVAIMGNLVIALKKFLAAAHTGSSAMLSEGIHSTADTEEVLLNIEAPFVPTLSANELAKIVSQLRRYYPDIKRIFMEVAPTKG